MNTIISTGSSMSWPLADAVVQRLGWVLVHSLWQFSLLALIVAGLGLALRRYSSNLRYGVLTATLAAAVIIPITTWTMLPVEISHASDAGLSPNGLETASHQSDGHAHEFADHAADPASHDSQSVAVRANWNSTLSFAGALTSDSRSRFEQFHDMFHPYLAWLVAGWGVGVVLCSLRPFLGWYTLHRLRRVGVSPVPPATVAALKRLSSRLGLRQAVGVVQSTLARVPVVIGYLRPVILLPVSLLTDLPPAQLEAILAHELAHVRRHDFVVNLLQAVIETLFFYHPAVWWISHRIRIEREHCCDDLVVAALDNRLEYGRALLAIAELDGRATLLAPGAADGSLLSRIRRIAGLQSPLVERRRQSTWLGVRSPASLISGACIVVAFVVTTNWGMAARLDQPSIANAPAQSGSRSDQSVGEVSSTSEVADAGPPAIGDAAAVPNREIAQVDRSPKPLVPLIGELPGGGSIEFVGITNNTAPAKNGWRPDGRPIGDIDNWPSTIVLHDQNSSSAYDKDGPHPKPDDNAIDALLRIRGLKAQPSLTLDLPTLGSSYHNNPVKDPYEMRISTRRRGDPSPGATWTNPDGVWRIGLTDEPWGRFVRISPEGKVIDPIHPDERYAATYGLIEIQGTKPHDRAPLGIVIAIQCPVGATDPENRLHRYAFEFRAVDTEGQPHWALEWQSRGRPDSKLQDSQWGLAQKLPDGKVLSHFEYRLRPYRHWVTFTGVSLQAGQETKVGVSVESLPAAKPAVTNAPPPTQVTPNGEIVGRLTHAVSGEPIAGATIACGAVINKTGGGGTNAVTNADGSFRLPVPSPGIYNVWLKKYDNTENLTCAADDGVLVEAGKASTSNLLLKPGRKVTGRVIDVDGNPISKVTVSCHSAARPHSGGVDSRKTTDDGAFEFVLPPGRAYIYAIESAAQTAENPFGIGRTDQASIQIPPTGDIASVKLTLRQTEPKFGDPAWLDRSTPGTLIVSHENKADVTGTIVDENGVPVVGAKVFKEDGPMTASNDKGEFRVEIAKGTQFIMHAFAPGYHMWFGTPTAGDALKVVLEKKLPSAP